MAIIRMTMDEIRREMTPERMAFEAERIRNHVDEYDEDCPPLTDEELSKFRHHKDIPPEIEIMARVRAAEEKMKTAEKTDHENDDMKPRRAA
ncbi:MAG: hypothetical protein IKN12_05445 [Selenomonadaceae bacterium]|nr:hypothetical protein [Selenomonadaceae bacterium]